MLEAAEDVFYYRHRRQRELPASAMPEGAEEASCRMYRLRDIAVQLLAPGAILARVIAAAELLEKDWGINAAVWSVTSFTELTGATACGPSARRFVPKNRLGATLPHGTQDQWSRRATTVSAVADLIRPYVPGNIVRSGPTASRSVRARRYARLRSGCPQHRVRARCSGAAIAEALRRYGDRPGTRPPW